MGFLSLQRLKFVLMLAIFLMFVSRHSPSSYHHNSHRYTEGWHSERGRGKTIANMSRHKLNDLYKMVQAQNQCPKSFKKRVIWQSLPMSYNCMIFFILRLPLKIGVWEKYLTLTPQKLNIAVFKMFKCNIQKVAINIFLVWLQF